MEEPIYNTRETTALLAALRGGVVPAVGIQHIIVGRNQESRAVLDTIQAVKGGGSAVKFWIGDFGSGKSFILSLIKTIALKQDFVVSEVDFTPERRLYDTGSRSIATYSAIMNNVAIKTKPDGNALATIIEKWITQIIDKVSKDHLISFDRLKDEKSVDLISQEIIRSISQFEGVGSFQFGQVIAKYYQGFITNDTELMRQALRWLKGEYTTRTDARQDLDVREIITDNNFYDYLKIFTAFFVQIGFQGFVINFDEAINLFKISIPDSRNKNYEKILSIYNDIMQGRVAHLFINFAGTTDFLIDSKRGLFSYSALKTRLDFNQYETTAIRDFSGPVIRLYPLSHEDIYILLTKLQQIFEAHFQTKSPITNQDIQFFMEEMFNKPGAQDFLTPRQVIREFLNLLAILKENPDTPKSNFLQQIEIEKHPDETTIEVL